MKTEKPLSEDQEQALLFQWANRQGGNLLLMFAIPNGGKRDARTAGKLKLTGVKAGVPDIFLPVAKGQFKGMFIEMKRIKGYPTVAQKKWIKDLVSQGYWALTCRGHAHAIKEITTYLGVDDFSNYDHRS